MDAQKLDEILDQTLAASGPGDATLVLAAAVRAAGAQIANGLAMVAQSISEVRDEILNDRLGRGA